MDTALGVNMAPQKEKRAEWSMGLYGLPGIVANMSMVGLMAALFWIQTNEMMRLAREDRQMFREELTKLHSDNVNQQKKLDDMVRSLDSLVREMKRERKEKS